MMTRQNLCYFIFLHSFYRVIEKLRISGWIKGIKASLVDQITGIQVFSSRLIKQQCPGECPGVWITRISRPPKSNKSPSCKILCGSPLKYPISVNIKLCRKIARNLCQIILNNLQ